MKVWNPRSLLSKSAGDGTTPSILEDAVEFAENPEPRCPCILLLDTSGSMKGEPLDALNEGLRTFQQELDRLSLIHI